ncbi:Hpt domain-containing protein [Flavobacterium sp.]|uniref:Hpt domain-containing protein n=1 Tax=Flavobacterium sp. TaxID=239 RepID=UPI00286BAB45|nr:Hpt domain-containing protein [Flavobacterium sp.]
MVDLTFLKKFTKDDTVKMKRYISLYLDVAPKTFAEMQRNFDNKDWDQLRINAHSLKPQADFMGISNLKEELNKIEEAVKMNNLKDIEKLFNSAFLLSSNSENTLKEILEQF